MVLNITFCIQVVSNVILITNFQFPQMNMELFAIREKAACSSLCAEYREIRPSHYLLIPWGPFHSQHG